MDDKKVIILMSTYNGEKYLEEQIESILTQTYKNIELFIRDDGSTDNTIKVLNKYKDNNKIRVEYGKNIGYKKSFYFLLKNTNDSDYFSFADQDDIWLENKIEIAVKYLNNLDMNKPALYYCNYDFYDKNMNFLSHAKKNKVEISFINSLVNFFNLGFTTVINSKLRMQYIKMPSEIEFSHDSISLIISIAFGNFIYDEGIYVKYRRHDKNVSPFSNKFIRFQIYRIKNYLISDSVDFKNIWKWFYNTYYDDLKYNEKKIIKHFINERYSIKNSLYRTFYAKRYRNTLFDELALRFLFLIGKL